MYRERIYHFAVGAIEVAAYAAPEDYTPDWLEDEDLAQLIDDIESGRVEWFAVTVEVRKNGHVIGSDHLGGCCYATIDEFVTGHRDADPMNRNCSLMRAARGQNVTICHYFPDMVRQAISDARETLRPKRAA